MILSLPLFYEKMVKLGSREEGVEETKENDTVHSDGGESVIDVQKPKRKLSEKQKEILRMGREKNLKMKRDVKNQSEVDKIRALIAEEIRRSKEEKLGSPPNSPPKLRRSRKKLRRRRKRRTPSPEESSEEEEYESADSVSSSPSPEPRYMRKKVKRQIRYEEASPSPSPEPEPMPQQAYHQPALYFR